MIFIIKKDTMARPKLKEDDKKIRLGVTISRELFKKIDSETNNKSEFIEKLLNKYFYEK
jgi:metal-responsive CopG/Arc/MetJ family transcriptional regulator